MARKKNHTPFRPINFQVYDIDGKTRHVKVSPRFKPQVGCAGKCPIEKRENCVHVRNGEKIKGEICCMSARQCCFFCFEEGCPVKTIYHDIIAHFGSLMTDDDEMMDDSTACGICGSDICTLDDGLAECCDCGVLVCKNCAIITEDNDRYCPNCAHKHEQRDDDDE